MPADSKTGLTYCPEIYHEEGQKIERSFTKFKEKDGPA